MEPELIGHLIWWTVGDPTVPDEELRAALAEHLPEVKPPQSVLPHDAFRRLTGPQGAKADYVLGSPDKPQEVTLSLLAARTTKNMLTRAIVRTVRVDGVNKANDKVGDVAFYKPPAGKPEKARLRVTMQGRGLPDEQQIKQFGESIREEYKRALSHMDAQAVRRAVRAWLAEVDAVPLNGPYFIVGPGRRDALAAFLARIGDASSMSIPVVDVEEARKLIVESIDDLELLARLAGRYHPLTHMGQAIKNRREEITHAQS